MTSPGDTAIRRVSGRYQVCGMARCLRTVDAVDDLSQQSAGTDSAGALHFEAIFVDFETLDLRIERSRGQP